MSGLSTAIHIESFQEESTLSMPRLFLYISGSRDHFGRALYSESQAFQPSCLGVLVMLHLIFRWARLIGLSWLVLD